MKTHYIKLGIVASLLILMHSCIKDDYFGLSKYGRIKKISVSNQSGNAQIDDKLREITVEIPAGVDLTQISVLELELSSFATASVKVGDTLDLKETYSIKVTSENGTEHDWTIKAYVASSNPQLMNSDFNLWYKTADGYFEPGESADNTIWGTGNAGSKLIGLYATTPLEESTDNMVAKLETLDNGFLGALSGLPITSGVIYSGYFDAENLDVSDPLAAAVFGINFSARPTSFSFDYNYAAGELNRNKQKEELNYPDSCEVYLTLDVDVNGELKRLATGWFRASTSNSEAMERVNIELTYGEIPSSYPTEAIPENGYVDDASLDHILPTKLTFYATSSFNGDLFEGAVGSVLKLDNLELGYE